MTPGNPCSLIAERNANDAPWIGHVLDSNQVAPVPVKAVATAGDDCVWLRQARGRSGREIDCGNAGRDRNVKLTVCAKSDAVCTWERALGPKRREHFLISCFPKERSAGRVRGVNCSIGRDGEIVELISVWCVVAIYKQPVLQIVANDSFRRCFCASSRKPFVLTAYNCPWRYRQTARARNLDRLGFGEILSPAFSIRGYDSFCATPPIKNRSCFGS